MEKTSCVGSEGGILTGIELEGSPLVGRIPERAEGNDDSLAELGRF